MPFLRGISNKLQPFVVDLILGDGHTNEAEAHLSFMSLIALYAAAEIWKMRF